MRRCLATVTLGALLLLAACTDGEPDAEPSPAPEAEGADEAEDPPATGLRIGVVLPPRDLGAADEVEAGPLGLDRLDTGHRDDVAELRTVVPDAAVFVPDVARLLVAEGYDLVCVLGRDAAEVVAELARRHAATDFCAAPAEPADEEAPGNLLLVDVAMAELGHIVGVTLHELAGDDPVALLGVGNRAGGESFRSGLRAGAGATPLREARGDLEDLEAEIDAALDDEVVAIAVDAGPDAAELVAGFEEVAVLAPVSLLSEEDAGALRWRVRWERVLEVVLAHLLNGETELPRVLGVAEEAFAIDHGPQAGGALVDAVEEAMGELERGERDPLEPLEEEDDDEDGDDADDGEDTTAPDVPEEP